VVLWALSKNKQKRHSSAQSNIEILKYMAFCVNSAAMNIYPAVLVQSRTIFIFYERAAVERKNKRLIALLCRTQRAAI
jgi:hypothetical protein